MEEDATNGQIEISVVWRGKTIVLKENEGTKIAELGVKLKELTGVSQDTLRLLVPQTKNAAPTSLTPFSDVHAALTLAEAGISEGQPIRMMGVFFSEIQEVSQPATKIEERILGFEEEEIRAKQLTASETTVAWKLPQGPYIFCDFRALQIPGIVLHPPPEKALSLMQRLASDPGIVAIMNKHRWRVGIMTELAPVGYVGVSPKCVLGFNQNFGEEISLRLRTDDLKGFRKFESIKKTLLHELAHMVHSEHDAQFLALNKQLEEEAISLDWTKSHAYSLSGSSRKAVSFSSASHEDVSVKKLGGNPRHFLTNARASATAAAIHRIQTLTSGDLTSSSSSTGIKNSTVNQSETSNVSYKTVEPDTHTRAQGINISTAGKRIEAVLDAKRALLEPDDDNNALDGSMLQKFHINGDFNEKDCCVGFNQQKSSTVKSGADPVNPQGNKGMDKNEKLCHQDLRNGEVHIMDNVRNVEPDPDDCKEGCNASSRLSGETVAIGIPSVQLSVSDDANLSDAFLNSKDKGSVDSSSNSSNGMEMISAHVPSATPLETVANISNPSSCKGSEGTCCMKPNTESIHLNLECIDESLKRIQDSTVATCTHLREVIQQLKHQVPPLELTNVIKFLLTIVRNILDHPREEKFRSVRKANPVFQRNIAKYEGALKVLNAIGFIEDKMTNNVGTVEAFLILKRSDPGLLWLAYSILEAHMT